MKDSGFLSLKHRKVAGDDPNYGWGVTSSVATEVVEGTATIVTIVPSDRDESEFKSVRGSVRTSIPRAILKKGGGKK